MNTGIWSMNRSALILYRNTLEIGKYNCNMDIVLLEGDISSLCRRSVPAEAGDYDCQAGTGKRKRLSAKNMESSGAGNHRPAIRVF